MVCPCHMCGLFAMARTNHALPTERSNAAAINCILLIALAFENCVDLAHAPLAFLYSDFVWGLCGSKVTRNTQAV